LKKGFSYTTNSYLSYAVGKGQKLSSQNYVKLLLISIWIVTVCLWALLHLFKSVIIEHFTTDDEMAKHFNHIFFIATNIFMFFDNTQYSLGAVLRAVGKERYACYVNLICYHCIGMPLSLILVFIFKFRLMGVWITLTIIIFLISALFYL